MVREKLHSHRIQCGPHCRDLRENVHAVFVLIHHPLDTPDLAGDALEPVLDLSFRLLHIRCLSDELLVPSGGWL